MTQRVGAVRRRLPSALCVLVLLVAAFLSFEWSDRNAVSSGPIERARHNLRTALMPGESRLALNPGQRRYRVAIPDDARLQVGFGALRGAWSLDPSELEFTVAFLSGDRRTVLLQRTLTPEDADRWHDVTLGLDGLGGRTGVLELTIAPRRAGATLRPAFVFWSNPVLEPARPRDGVSVLLMSIDTLRADHLGCYGYARDTSPNIDRLAREGILFRQAVSASTWTLPSHASMFTSTLPSRHGAVRRGFSTPLSGKFDTLAELLWDRGYRTAGFTGGGFVLFGLDQGFERYANPGADTDKVAVLTRTVEHSAQWMRERHDVPFFGFFHTYAVHMPYAPPEPYRSMFQPPPHPPPVDGFDVPGLVSLYDGEIRHMDAVVEGLFDAVRSSDLAQRTCIILTADHGEEFQEHGALFHDHAKVYEELLRVPLIVWCPSRYAGGRVIEQPVSLVDILPTVLDVAGIPIPRGVVGRSLTPLLRGETLPERVTVTEVHASVEGDRAGEGWVRAFRTAHYKVIESSRDGGRQAFDLQNDPGETRDIGLGEPAVLDAFSAALQSTPLPGPTLPARPPTPDQATLERLRALGYMP